MPEEVSVEDILDGPGEHRPLQRARGEPVLVQGPVARHGLHLVHHPDHPVQLVLATAHLALLSQ